MNYIAKLKESAQKYDSIICMGLDPVIEKIPVKTDNIYDKIYNFYSDILNEILKKKIYPSAVKPNYAYYAQYGLDGIKALKDLIDLYKKEGFLVILDVKRGDIGTTAAAYANESFSFFNADAVTLAPYMGLDSIKPFLDNYPDKGYYVLCKTSNKSSVDFQNLEIENEPLYMKVAEKIVQWYKPGIGAVTGATFPEELESILKTFEDSNKEVPLLLPGIGAQGGDLKAVISLLQKHSNILIQRINSSSGINYAYIKQNNDNYAEAAVNAIKELNDNISDVMS